MQLQREEEQAWGGELFCKALKSSYISSPSIVHNITSRPVVPIVLFSVAVGFCWQGVDLLCVITTFSSDILSSFLVPCQDLSMIRSWSSLDKTGTTSHPPQFKLPLAVVFFLLHLSCPCPMAVFPFGLLSFILDHVSLKFELALGRTQPDLAELFFIVLGACFIVCCHFNQETSFASWNSQY